MSLPPILPGFREFPPEAMALRTHLFRLWRQAAVAHGFSEYDAPLLEPLELFTKKAGPEIEEQLFSFTDKGGRPVALRPETTPGVARMVGLRAASLKRPIRWFSIGEQFRYERQQKGRLRSFFQFNADVFGEPGPAAELELLSLLIAGIAGFGLGPDDFRVRLSDRTLWAAFLRAAGVAEDAGPAALAAIDKLGRDPEDAIVGRLEALCPGQGAELLRRSQELAAARSLEAVQAALGPAAGDPALAARFGQWETLLRGLTDMGLDRFIEIDLGVVRGLAYYTGFVFEAFDRQGEFRAIAGGGRYDHLVERLGGPALPAVGFAIGDVVLGELLAARGRLPPLIAKPDLYVVIGGPAERPLALGLVRRLREAGWRTEYPWAEAGMGRQFKAADQVGARLAVILGSDEVARGVAKLRDMGDGREAEVPLEGLEAALREWA